MRRLAALALFSLALASPVAAQDAYDPIAQRLTPTETWTTTSGALALSHAQVTVPGPGVYDVDLDLPDGLTCPIAIHLKRKLRDHSLVAVEALLQSMGRHEDTGFVKVRVLQWGAGPSTLHIAVDYCR